MRPVLDLQSSVLQVTGLNQIRKHLPRLGFTPQDLFLVGDNPGITKDLLLLTPPVVGLESLRL